MKPIRLVILGANGKMGKSLVAICKQDMSKEISTIVPISDKKGIDGLFPFFKDADAVIDFSHPDYASMHAVVATATQTPLLICTTPISDNTMRTIDFCLDQPYVKHMSNTSFGMVSILESISFLCRNLKGKWNCTITDIHEESKIDSPSGTALQLASIIRHQLPDGCKIVNISKRTKKYNAGEHIITFTGGNDTITLTHKVHSREAYVKGALSVIMKMVNS